MEIIKRFRDRIFLFSKLRGIYVFIFMFLFFHFYTEHFVYWSIFTERDIQRTIGWLNGSFYWPGPEMTGGRNLPGPFFYFLLSPFLIFDEKIYHLGVQWYVIWLSLTYATAYFLIQKITVHRESASIFLILFIAVIGKGTLWPLLFAWNPGFSIIFHILSAMCLYLWRATDKNFYLYLTGFAIAFGVQTHFLVLVHIITPILFYCFNKKIRFMPVLGFLFLSLFPFICYGAMGYFHVFNAYHFHTGYLKWLSGQIFSESWFRSIKTVVSSCYIMPIIFCFFQTLIKKWKTGKWPITKSTADILIIIAIPFFIMILAARIPWYVYVIPVFLMFLFVKWCDDLMPNSPSKRSKQMLIYLGLFICSLMLFTNGEFNWPIGQLFSMTKNSYIVWLSIPLGGFFLMPIYRKKIICKNIAANSLVFIMVLFIVQVKVIKHLKPYKRSISESFTQTYPTQQELYPLLKRIFLETQWPPRLAMKRIYAIGIHPERSFLAHYSMAKEKAIEELLSVSTKARFAETYFQKQVPQGYMIIQHLNKFSGYSHTEWNKYLLESRLFSPFLRQEIEQGKFLIRTPQLYGQYWLIPYQTTRRSVFVEGFHNLGQPYYWEEPEWLKNCASVQQFKDREGFYYCMALPGHLNRAGVHIKLTEKTQKTSSSLRGLNISFFGPLIGSSDCCSNNAYALWSDIHINLFCSELKIKLTLPSIGSNHKLQKIDITKAGKRFYAPLKLRVPIKKLSPLILCKRDKIREVELTFNHTLNGSSLKEEKRISWKKYY